MKRAINFTLIRDNSAGKKILNRNQFHRMKLAFRSDFRLEMIGEQKYEIEIMSSKKKIVWILYKQKAPVWHAMKKVDGKPFRITSKNVICQTQIQINNWDSCHSKLITGSHQVVQHFYCWNEAFDFIRISPNRSKLEKEVTFFPTFHWKEDKALRSWHNLTQSFSGIIFRSITF